MAVDFVPLIEKFVLSYIEKHPEVLEKVIHSLLDKLIEQITQVK